MKHTAIQWCDDTVNPVMGCTGCELWRPDDGPEGKRCYAGKMHEVRHSHPGFAPEFGVPKLFPGRMLKASRCRNLTGVKRKGKPWLGRLPRLIFISDMGDALSEGPTIDADGKRLPGVPFQYLKEQIFDIVTTDLGRQHIWLWLTKRPKRMTSFGQWLLAEFGQEWPANLWPGTSVTSASNLGRVADLAQVGNSGTTRFISAEPLWEEISLVPYLSSGGRWWVIAGGESVQGKGAEPHEFKLEWARKLRDECSLKGVPFFLKQLGSKPTDDSQPVPCRDRHAGDWSEWPPDLKVRELPDQRALPRRASKVSRTTAPRKPRSRRNHGASSPRRRPSSIRPRTPEIAPAAVPAPCQIAPEPGAKNAAPQEFDTAPSARPPVDGGELLDRLVSILSGYVSLPPYAAETIALWILHTHALDAAYVSPILAVVSPTKRCGKSTLLTLLDGLTRNAALVSNITAAGVFRTVQVLRPTLLIDEGETFLGNEDLRGILNSGHLRRTARVIRVNRDTGTPEAFSTWSPKAIALIGRLHPTLEDRSITIQMRRRSTTEILRRLRQDRIEEELKPLHEAAAEWAAQCLEALKDLDPSVPEELNDRAQDNWRPLLAIAHVAGRKWPDNALRAALHLSGQLAHEDPSAGTLLLADIKELFRRERTDRLPSECIVGRLLMLEDRQWGEWQNGSPISKHQVARLLSPFGIHPRVIRVGGRTPHGYSYHQFTDAFARYLPPEPQQEQQPQSMPRSEAAPGEADGMGEREGGQTTAAAEPMLRMLRSDRSQDPSTPCKNEELATTEGVA